MKASAVVVIGVGRREIGRDNGAPPARSVLEKVRSANFALMGSRKFLGPSCTPSGRVVQACLRATSSMTLPRLCRPSM